MIVSLGMLVTCYCLTRLFLVPLTMPGAAPPSRSLRFTVCLVVALGILGVGYCAWVLLDQGTDRNDERPRVGVR